VQVFCSLFEEGGWCSDNVQNLYSWSVWFEPRPQLWYCSVPPEGSQRKTFIKPWHFPSNPLQFINHAAIRSCRCWGRLWVEKSRRHWWCVGLIVRAEGRAMTSPSLYAITQLRGWSYADWLNSDRCVDAIKVICPLLDIICITGWHSELITNPWQWVTWRFVL
jgi:hypothetical protein